MDDHSLPNSDSSQDGFSIRPSEWRFDLVRAQRERTIQTAGTLDSLEKSMGKVKVMITQVSRLIREYVRTGERVGANIDQATLLRIVDKLKREARGDRHWLGEIAEVTAKERFLAESLYSEILEMSGSRVTRRVSREDVSLMGPEEWEDCLEILADAISRNHFPFSR